MTTHPVFNFTELKQIKVYNFFPFRVGKCVPLPIMEDGQLKLEVTISLKNALDFKYRKNTVNCTKGECSGIEVALSWNLASIIGNSTFVGPRLVWNASSL